MTDPHADTPWQDDATLKIERTMTPIDGVEFDIGFGRFVLTDDQAEHVARRILNLI
jgi:hypothetical protein